MRPCVSWFSLLELEVPDARSPQVDTVATQEHERPDAAVAMLGKDPLILILYVCRNTPKQSSALLCKQVLRKTVERVFFCAFTHFCLVKQEAWHCCMSTVLSESVAELPNIACLCNMVCEKIGANIWNLIEKFGSFWSSSAERKWFVHRRLQNLSACNSYFLFGNQQIRLGAPRMMFTSDCFPKILTLPLESSVVPSGEGDMLNTHNSINRPPIHSQSDWARLTPSLAISQSGHTMGFHHSSLGCSVDWQECR